MRGRTRVPEREILGERWARWSAIVELHARGRLARRRVDAVAYQSLHRELIAACRSLAGSAGEEERGFYEGLEGLISPWLSPSTLAQADREILDGLLARCREVGRRLGGRRWALPLGAAGGGSAPPAAAVAGALVLGALALAMGTMPERVRDWSDVIWLAARRSSDAQRMAVVAVVVVSASVRVVSRAARS